MKPITTTIPQDTPSIEAVERAVIEALAEVQETSSEAVRIELLAAGPQMPLDSLETVEIMLSLESAFGIRFPETKETCAAFASVSAVVELVRNLAVANAQHEGAPQ
jgi:acyl carrier protein